MQTSLFGRSAPVADLSFPKIVRLDLEDGAWIEHLPEWVAGHAELFEVLRSSTQWAESSRWMYDKTVAVPRLFGSIPEDGPGHPILLSLREALTARYGEVYDRISIAYYRDGRDSVAWHGDRVGERDCVIPIVSVGGPRKLLLKHRGSKRSLAFKVGWGDLLVMGGTCQRTWQHCVPKQRHAEPRMAIMFRQSWVHDL